MFDPNNEKDKKVITFLKENLQNFFDITTAVEKIKRGSGPKISKKVEDRAFQETTVSSFNILGSGNIIICAGGNTCT